MAGSNSFVARFVAAFLVVGFLLMAGTFLHFRFAPAPLTADEQVASLMGKLQTNPNDTGTLLELGKLFATMGNNTQAEQLFAKAASLAPENPSTHFWQGYTLSSMGRYSEAAASFEASIALKKDPKAMLNLATIYTQRLQAPDKARSLYQAILALPDVPDSIKDMAARELQTLPTPKEPSAGK